MAEVFKAPEAGVAAPAPKAFLELKGTHNDAYTASRDDYLKGLDSFMTSHQI